MSSRHLIMIIYGNPSHTHSIDTWQRITRPSPVSGWIGWDVEEMRQIYVYFCSCSVSFVVIIIVVVCVLVSF